MAVQDVAAALLRTERVLTRRPATGVHADATAVAQWAGGARIVAAHENGHEVATDMPPELGGEGEEVSPGWLVRAGLAACSATSIAMAAAAEGIELTELEVRADSRSDMRGVLGMAAPDGTPVFPGLMDVRMHVRIAAAGVAPDRLRALVAKGQRNAPMLATLNEPAAVSVTIDVGES